MLEASDTLAGAVGKLAAGNLGAACVLKRIVHDPFEGVMILMDLESIDLRGEDIWLLYRDVHHMDLDGFIQDVKARAGCHNRLRI
jgi:exosome complex RNA-binding protein Rrp42 (RNase PH superfamily)